MKHTRIFLLALIGWLSAVAAWAIDPPKKEVRAVWLTTVYGLDWPHRPATNQQSRVAQQQALIDILDRLQAANFNTVFLQTRLRGDVIYRSAIEPASKTFSGRYGELPGYDPLAFAIEECHKRGMECHAWFVTFPLGTEKSVKEMGKLSVVSRHPKLCKRHNGEWYLDPGVAGTADYLLSLVKEIVEGYDIDGIHFDYIRYPEEAKRFPDSKLHKQAGKGSKLADWRRENINRLVYRLYDYVKQAKPWVQVSSSPLGKYSRIEQVPNAGWTAFESVYQDPKQWIAAGKQDMVVPMMYYLHKNFFPFVDNWVSMSQGRLIVPGLGAYRMDKSEADWSLNDITDQIDYSRYYGGAGCAFFRCGNVLYGDKGLYKELQTNYYRYPAQLPPLTWLSDRVPAAPKEIRVERHENELCLSWDRPADEKEELTYTVYYAQGDSIDTQASKSLLATLVHGERLYLPVDTLREQAFSFSVSASTRYHIESVPSKETFYYLSKYIK